MTNVKIEVAQPGHAAKIELNGVDVADVVKAFILSASVRDQATLELALVPKFTQVGADVKISIDPMMEKILEAAGWTPPGSCALGCR